MPRGKSRPKIKLTKTRVDQLKSDDPGGTRFYDSELPKFGITVFATGRRSWFIEYMAGNRRRATARCPTPSSSGCWWMPWTTSTTSTSKPPLSCYSRLALKAHAENGV